MKTLASITVAAILMVAGAFSAGPAGAATIPGDVNGDCSVNSTDLMLVASRFGTSYGSLRYIADYDLNHDRRISAADIQMVAVWFGTLCG